MTTGIDNLRAYGELFERLSPATLDELDGLCRPDMRFVDPFHDVTGLPAVKRMFAGMFTAFEAPRFTVDDLAMGVRGGFLSWRFEGRLRRGGMALAFPGTSLVGFDADGYVAFHHDHWDAAASVHARLPLLGPVVRAVGRRIARQAGSG